jgi:hypothetical protein
MKQYNINGLKVYNYNEKPDVPRIAALDPAFGKDRTVKTQWWSPEKVSLWGRLQRVIHNLVG